MSVPCKKCAKENCYAHCQVAEDGVHQVDPKSASSPDAEPGNLLVDFLCKLCSQAGACRVEDKNIEWE